MRTRPVSRSSICARWLPASETYQIAALRRAGDAVGAAAARRLPHLHVLGARVEAAVDAVLAGEPEVPRPSKTPVLRLALAKRSGSCQSCTRWSRGSTRAIAFCPPSVTQAAPSGPRMTPCGAAPWPRFTAADARPGGSSRFSVPLRWPQNQKLPSPAAVMSREPTRPAPGACGVEPGDADSRAAPWPAPRRVAPAAERGWRGLKGRGGRGGAWEAPVGPARQRATRPSVKLRRSRCAVRKTASWVWFFSAASCGTRRITHSPRASALIRPSPSVAALPFRPSRKA